MEQNRWKLKDVLVVLTIVFAGSYGFEYILYPGLISGFSTAQRYLFFGLLQAFLFVVSVFAVVLYRYRGNLRQLGLGKNFSLLSISEGVLGGIGLFFTVLLSGLVISALTPVQPKLQPFAELLLKAKTPFEVFVPFLIGGFLAPLGEEIYFRGFAYPVFKKKFGLVVGIIVSAVFFSALHFDFLRFFPLAVGGAGLAWLYETSNSLITPILAHSVWNLSMLSLFYFALP